MSGSPPLGDQPPRRSSAGFAAGRAVLLLTAAVFLGVVLLQALDKPPGTDGLAVRTTTPEDETTTTRRSTRAATTLPPTTLPPARPVNEIKVLPVNGTNISGVGGRTGEVLKRRGYNVLAAANTPRPVESSSVLHVEGREADARLVAAELGLPETSVALLGSPPPLDTKTADVVVIAGPDLAARLAQTTNPPTTARRATTATTARSAVRPIPTTAATGASAGSPTTAP